MPLTDKGRDVEKHFQENLYNLFDGFNREGYLLEIAHPGTRTEGDWRVHVYIYERKFNNDKTMTIRQIGEAKISEPKLKDLSIPEYFLKMGKIIEQEIKSQKALRKVNDERLESSLSNIPNIPRVMYSVTRTMTTGYYVKELDRKSHHS